MINVNTLFNKAYDKYNTWSDVKVGQMINFHLVLPHDPHTTL